MIVLILPCSLNLRSLRFGDRLYALGRAEVTQPKDCNPDERLIKFMQERLKVSKAMDKLEAAGKEIPDAILSQNRSLGTKKVRILDDYIFPSLANLFYFFDTITHHPELQEKFEDDIKDLLGVRRYNPREDN